MPTSTRRSLSRAEVEPADHYDEEGAAALEEVLAAPRKASDLDSWWAMKRRFNHFSFYTML